MPFNARHVTNSLLQRGFKEARTDMSPMKVQKLLFYLNGWHLAITGKPAVDQPFEVWAYGPVVKRIYKDLKDFGGKSVSSYIKEGDSVFEPSKAFVVSDQCKEFYDILDLTWEKYIGVSATRLSAMTHEPGSPWDVARQRGETLISDSLIKDYFVELASAR